ncbi:MAG: zinc-ribbon domain-containing protein, partial [Myxococcota bacterium]|nr:zinc-ribbon domain-containing protein [Myxococcota bacterium]
MKFLCEQCKAKYQIADEKAAGKTVRMKCRKCGYLIEVRAEVQETRADSSGPSAVAEPMPPPGPTAASEARSLRARPAQK